MAAARNMKKLAEEEWPMPDVAVAEPVADAVQADAFLAGITALLPEIRARASEPVHSSNSRKSFRD